MSVAILLKIISGPDTGSEFSINPGYNYYIGRDDNCCQIVLNDPEVSRQHAILSVQADGKFYLSDNNSSNGTFVNNKPISTSVAINPDTSFSVGSTTIMVSISDTLYAAQHQDYPFAGGRQTYTGREVYDHNETSVITIGREPGNNVVLDHPHVSRRHAEIETTREGSFIRDLNSTNGTYVDGARINGKQAISGRSTIRISGYKLSLENLRLIKQDETGGKVEIDARNISKVVTLPGGEQRVILNNLNFKIKPCEFVAILGGSGAGKSTLLQALMGIWPATSGELLVNGAGYYEQYAALKSMIGYVPQDDIVHLDLSVEEVLSYAASLRMPDDTSIQERQARIEQVLQALGLAERRTTEVKNLSGGQRKRVSIGVELITKPSIMFLDEPTSGLDPGLEKIMMEMMRNMANQGQTIFLVTHATFNIHLCDKIIFLTEGGHLAFFGTPSEALTYFRADDFADIYKMINTEKSSEEWQYNFAASKYAVQYQPGCQSEFNGGQVIGSGRTRTSSLRQWYNLTSRYTRSVLRDKKNLLVMLMQPLIISALVSIVFLDSAPVFEESHYSPEDVVVTEAIIAEGRLLEVNENSSDELSRNRAMSTVIFAMVLSAVWCGVSIATREIIKEIVIYKRERFVNLQIAPYLMSKVVVLSLICALQALIFTGIVWVFIGLPGFYSTTLAFFLIALSSALMGLTISAIAPNANFTTSSLPIILIPQFLLAGVVVPIETVKPEALQKIFYAVISKWGFELIGGRIIDINSLSAFQDPPRYSNLDGSFESHWWIILAFIAFFYLASTVAMLARDKDLS